MTEQNLPFPRYESQQEKPPGNSSGEKTEH